MSYHRTGHTPPARVFRSYVAHANPNTAFEKGEKAPLRITLSAGPGKAEGPTIAILPWQADIPNYVRLRNARLLAHAPRLLALCTAAYGYLLAQRALSCLGVEEDPQRNALLDSLGFAIEEAGG